VATVLDYVTDALQRIMVLSATETPSSEDAAKGLFVLNDLLDQWKTESLLLYASVRTTWTITANDGEYTVGSGANISVPRPQYVDQVNFVDTSMTPDLEMPMTALTDAAYAAIPMKDLTSTYPQYYYYNPTVTTGTLTLWPTPTSSTLTGALYARTQVAEFAATSTTVTVPPGWRRMISSNLALELCPYFERDPSPSLVKAAMDSKAAVKRSNIRLQDMTLDPGALIQTGSGGSWLRFYTGP